MEYTIGTIIKHKEQKIILKTVAEAHTNYTGRLTLEQKLGNTRISDTFTIINKYYTVDAPDGAYDWYYIKDHYREEDRSEEVRAQMDQQITDLEIENMEQEQDLTDLEIAVIELQNA